MLEGRRIVVGVTGSIAAYKAADLVSKLAQAGAEVDVILTESAQQFVTPMTFHSLTGREVYTDIFEVKAELQISHVELSRRADAVVIAPASATTIARIAHGLADNLLSLTVLATKAPVLLAPAMDSQMYENPATQANLALLKERGMTVVGPEEGRLATGRMGRGRLVDTETLLGAIRQVMGRNGVLKGRKVVVTAGGTREALDPVRFLSNRSSGKQGHALAQAAIDAGAEVTLISTAQLPTPYGVKLVAVDSAESMLRAVLEHTRQADALIMAAAVSDFRPNTVSEQKIKKSDDGSGLTIELGRNPDILLEVKAQREVTGYPRAAVGFAAESEDLIEHAQEKLQRKGLDMLVANDITAKDAGFEVDSNRVVILDAQGGQQPLELASKARVAEVIVQRVGKIINP